MLQPCLDVCSQSVYLPSYVQGSIADLIANQPGKPERMSVMRNGYDKNFFCRRLRCGHCPQRAFARRPTVKRASFFGLSQRMRSVAVVSALLAYMLLTGCATNSPSAPALLGASDSVQRLEETVRQLSSAIAAGQATPADYLERGHAYYRLGRFDQARNDFDQARRMDGQSAMVFFNLGTAACRQQHYNEAVNDFTRALTLDAGLARAYNNRGVAYYFLGEYAKAVADFSKAAESTNAGGMAALFNRAMAFQAMKDHDRAMADYDMVLAKKPDTVAALNNKADILIGLGRFDQAILVLDAAITVAPNDPDLLFNRALAHERLGHLQKAQSDYDRTLALNGHFGQAYRNRGVLRLQVQKNHEGCDDLRHACSLGLCTQLEKVKKFGLCD